MAAKKNVTTEATGLSIIALEARNVMRIRAVKIFPHPTGMVVIGGRNAQGKSSAINTISMTIGGKKLVPDEPLRRGAKSGFGRVTLGRGGKFELEVERRVTRTGTTLHVRDKTGKVKGPQVLLDSLKSALCFDPLEFSRMTGAEQAKALREIAGVDTTEDDALIVQAREDRRLVGRELAEAKAKVSGTRDVDAPDEPVEFREVYARLEAARAQEAEQDDRQERIESLCCTEIPNAKREIKELEDALSEARVALSKMEETARKTNSAIEAHVPMDVAAIQKEIAQIGETNKLVSLKKARTEALGAVDTKQAAYEEGTRRIESLEERKAAKLASAIIPVPGLAWSEDEITYQGIPFSQASQAEQLRISTAIALSQAKDLRVMLIRDGSLLDPENLALLAEMAEENGCQVWIERVGAGPECSIIIDDGAVAGDDTATEAELDAADEALEAEEAEGSEA